MNENNSKYSTCIHASIHIRINDGYNDNDNPPNLVVM